MGAALSEQETTISYCRESNEVHIWTSDSTVMTKLDRMCMDFPETYKCTEEARAKTGGELISKSYSIADKRLISFRGKKKKPNMTEEQKRAAAERLRNLRAMKRKAGF